MNLPHKFERNAGLFITLVLLLMQIACDTGGNDAAAYNDLVLKFHADRLRVRVGEPVHMQFTVKNSGNQVAVVESKDTPVMDIIVEVVGGPELLTWSSQNLDKVAHRLEWQPGESKVIDLVWIPRQETVYRVSLGGLLYKDSKIVQGANVTVCVSNLCP